MVLLKDMIDSDTSVLSVPRQSMRPVNRKVCKELPLKTEGPANKASPVNSEEYLSKMTSHIFSISSVFRKRLLNGSMKCSFFMSFYFHCPSRKSIPMILSKIRPDSSFERIITALDSVILSCIRLSCTASFLQFSLTR